MKLTRNQRLRAAAILWILVAIFLLYRGFVPHFARIEALWLQIAALVLGGAVGFAKGRFVLAKSALRTTRFIARRPERDWIWFSIHPVLWVLIPVMIAMGLTVRRLCAESHPWVVVALYFAIAVALIVGARSFRQPPFPDGDPVEESLGGSPSR